MRPPRTLSLATFATLVLLTACSGGDAEKTPDAGGNAAGSGSGQVSEASKGKACEQYRDLSAQVEAASDEAAGVTVSNEEDGQKVTELMTKVSELTEKADAAYALCYAEGAEPQASSS